MADLVRLLSEHNWILGEAAVVESLRRNPAVSLHPLLANTPLVRDPAGRQALGELYDGFLGLAAEASVPLMLCAPTWRANRARIEAAGLGGNLNAEAIRFVRTRIEGSRLDPGRVALGGLLGCRGDCYQPAEALPAGEAHAFHRWQADALAAARPDFLFATTLPAVEEARGLGRAMAETGLPYLLSFVLGSDGRILDGTPLPEAISRLDSELKPRPLGFGVNCSYPTFLHPGDLPAATRSRLLLFQANASARDQSALDGSPELHAEPVEEWGRALLQLHQQTGIKILAGCCGTGLDHLRFLVSNR